MSLEPARTKPYSSDIAWRVVWQRIGMGMSFREIASRLQIGVGTAHRLYKRFEESGEVSPKKRGSRPESRKLDDLHELYVLGLVLENPSLYLRELCQKIKEATGTTVSSSCVCKLLHRNGFTRKKISQIAKQRCVEFRGDYMARILHYPRDYLVFLDETGSDHRDHIRKFGYSMRGETPIYHRFLLRGNRISAIAALSSEGILEYDFYKGTVNGDKFFDFVRGNLIPNMQPFPSSKSILIMDNCTIHHVREVKDILDAAGILVIFLPPYSPDYNPVENLFSYVKYYLKDHDEIMQCDIDPLYILKAAFQSVTVENCNAWISGCGYQMD